MKPRSLVLLRINDGLSPTSPPIETAADIHEDAPPPEIDVMRFTVGRTQYVAIDGWERALEFWRAFSAERPPDLVVADVKFNEDKSSPLQFNGGHADIPTGLNHLKPIASMSRALGTPVGIAIHTADVGRWEALVRDDNDRMGYLAAHEIGELAAILGENVPLTELHTRDDRLRWCWRWLRQNTKTIFEPALGIALRNYRHQLIWHSRRAAHRKAAWVTPEDWTKMLLWCDKMQDRSARHDEIPSLSFVPDDGPKDCVMLESVFADSAAPLCDLPSDCFAYDVNHSPKQLDKMKPWELDNRGYPRIGTMLYALGRGSLAESGIEADKLLRKHFSLPIGDERPTYSLSRVKRSKTLVRGLAIVLQILWIEWINFKEWLDVFSKHGWNPDECKSDNAYGGETLKEWLTKIHRMLAKANRSYDDSVYAEDVQEKIKQSLNVHLKMESVRWHLALLVASGVASTKQDAQGIMYRSREFNLSTPPLPDPSPNGMEIIATNLKSYLRDSLGINDEDDNQLRLMLNAAFVYNKGKPNERAAAGGDWLDRFLDGRGPAWLIEVCRQHARETIGWKDELTWPICIRGE